MDFKETMKWAAKNKLTFSVKELPDGSFTVEAKTDRIMASYPFSDTDTLLDAFWSAAYAVESGTKFHQTHGYVPGKTYNGYA